MLWKCPIRKRWILGFCVSFDGVLRAALISCMCVRDEGYRSDICSKLYSAEWVQATVSPHIGMSPIVRLEAALSNQQQKTLSQMFPLCRYTPLLLNEAKLVLQKQNVDKRGNTKVGFINSCKQNYLKRCEIKIWRKRGRKGRVCGERKSTTVAGKRSHSCFFRFPSKHSLWSGGVLAVPSVVAATVWPSPDGLFSICNYCMWWRYS